MITLSDPIAPIKVLVADDSATVRKFIELALAESERPCDVVSVSDGRDAVMRLQSETFDIAFLDIHMPHLNGVEVMGALHLQGAQTFGISMSTSLTGHSETLLKSFGAYDFLTKPFTKLQVLQIVETFGTLKKPFDILVVDDSATVRKIVLKVLRRSIFRLDIAEADSGEQAIERTQSRHYRIIFVDLNMPGMNGIELAENLASSSKGSDVIMMSSEYTEALDAASERVGARAFLRKPFYPEDVDSVLHHLFGLRHPRFSKHVRIFA